MRSFLITFERSCWSSVRKQSNFADGRKLGGVVDRSDGCTVIQSDFDKLEKWANRSHEVAEFMPCSTQEWRSNSMNPSRRGAGQLESSFPGKITDILVENKCQQHPLQSGLHFRRMSPAAQRRWLFLSAQPWWDTSVVLGSVLGSRYERNRDILEQVWQKAMKVIEG